MKKKTTKTHPLAMVLFILYLMVLFYLLFFSESYRRNMREGEYRYNLELFKEIKRFWRYRELLGFRIVATNLLGNIAAFVPFGFFLPMFTKSGKNVLACTFASMLFSTAAELIQLVTKVGAFDVDDIFLNSIGGFIGFLIYYFIWHKIIEKKWS